METGRAMIERGEIIGSQTGGYQVKSMDRYGIVTPPIEPIHDTMTFSVGDMVYYFAFPDGTGRIICGI